MIKIVVVNEANQTLDKINSKSLLRLTKGVLRILLNKRLRNLRQLQQKNELILVFLSTQQIKSVNNQFRQKNKPTDVLSFSSTDPRCLGELLFSIGVLKKQAKAQNHSLQAEFVYMFIHGVLHLLGYDHEISKKEEKLMFVLQDRIFAEVCEKLNLDSKANLFKN